jgi:hypothetical protein
MPQTATQHRHRNPAVETAVARLESACLPGFSLSIQLRSSWILHRQKKRAITTLRRLDFTNYLHGSSVSSSFGPRQQTGSKLRTMDNISAGQRFASPYVLLGSTVAASVLLFVFRLYIERSRALRLQHQGLVRMHSSHFYHVLKG